MLKNHKTRIFWNVAEKKEAEQLCTWQTHNLHITELSVKFKIIHR